MTKCVGWPEVMKRETLSLSRRLRFVRADAATSCPVVVRCLSSICPVPVKGLSGAYSMLVRGDSGQISVGHDFYG